MHVWECGIQQTLPWIWFLYFLVWSVVTWVNKLGIIISAACQDAQEGSSQILLSVLVPIETGQGSPSDSWAVTIWERRSGHFRNLCQCKWFRGWMFARRFYFVILGCRRCCVVRTVISPAKWREFSWSSNLQGSAWGFGPVLTSWLGC